MALGGDRKPPGLAHRKQRAAPPTSPKGAGPIAATPSTIVDHALAVADRGLRVFLVEPMGKRPLSKGWQDEATSDPNEIIRMFAEHPRANYGVRTGSVNDLIVIDLDGPAAVSWWKATGLAEAATATVSTPSGPDHQHVYFRIEGTEIGNSQSKLAAKVDVRGEGGYVVGPGSMLPTGTYQGRLGVIPDAPSDLLSMIPERQEYAPTQSYEGPAVDEPSESELRQIASAVSELDALPRVWSEGAGWRSTMYRIACWFSRMVNSDAYALTETGALQILLANTPTDEVWGRDQILEQWVSARRSTEGQYASLPVEEVQPLLPFADVANLLPHNILTDLVIEEPDSHTPGALWKRRQQVLRACFDLGFTAQQAATVAWSCSASRDLQGEPGALSILWNEVEKARILSDVPAGPADVEAPVRDLTSDAVDEIHTPYSAPTGPERPGTKALDRIPLLTPEEREIAQTEWWGSRYIDWVETRVPVLNLPYHRLNRWSILSLQFSSLGFIPSRKPGGIGLNLFSMNLGKTTTGKTEAFELAMSVVAACFPAGESPDIGGDATTNSLVEKLIERDGKPSFFNADEAHGLFQEMEQATWRAGLMQKWTALYDGKVPMMLRATKKDVSGVQATSHFVMYLMGTVDGMLGVLDETMWESGFLARFVFAIGHEGAEETFEEDDQEGDVIRGYEAMPKQWAAEFANARSQLRRFLPVNQDRLPIGMDDDARARHVQFKEDMAKMFDGHRQEHLFTPTRRRFATNVRKCASLIAMTEGATSVTLRHELIALEQAEEWLANIAKMIEGTTATALTRSVDELERYIAGQSRVNGVRLERVYSNFNKVDHQFVDRWITQLSKEGRVVKEQVPGKNAFVLKINPQKEASS